MENKARLREVQVQVFQGSKPKGPQRDITFDGEKIRCGGAVIKVSPSEPSLGGRSREHVRVGNLDAWFAQNGLEGVCGCMGGFNSAVGNRLDGLK
jgi:hypothetical protein